MSCPKCYVKRAADGSWTEDVRCALHPVEPPKPKPIKKLYRVTWTELYCEDILAENASQAMEERSGDNAFQECNEVNAAPVCQKCEGRGKGSRGGRCGACLDGVLPEEVE